MDQDKIEIISEQLHALKVLWNLLRTASLDNIDKERCEELLLEIFDIKQNELEISIRVKQ